MKRSIIILILFTITRNIALSQKDETFRRTDPISEQMELFIKTQIENHEEGSYSNIKILPIYNSQEPLKPNYIEFAAFKYLNSKSFIILAGAKQVNKTTRETSLHNFTVITVSEQQCKKLMEKYEGLVAQINPSNAIRNEKIYADYTVSDKLFISFKASSVTIGATNRIDVYINGARYTVDSDDFIKTIKIFLNY